jgi:hypothetical protein
MLFNVLDLFAELIDHGLELQTESRDIDGIRI